MGFEQKRAPSRVETLPDIVYERDLEGHITDINAAGERFFGRPRGQLIGRPLHESFASEAYRGLQATNERLISGGEDRSLVSLRDASGAERVLETLTTLIRDSWGRPCGARGVMRDVTERVRLETELRQKALELARANEALREAHESRARLTSMIVHDLRTPLTVITATLDLLGQRLPQDELVELAARETEERPKTCRGCSTPTTQRTSASA